MLFSPEIIAVATIAAIAVTGLACAFIARSDRGQRQSEPMTCLSEETPIDAWRQAGIL